MGLFDKLIGGGLKGIADGAKSVIDSINAPKEERIKAQAAIDELKAKHESEVLAASTEIEKAFLADVSNAREANVKIQGSSPSWVSKNVAYIIDIFVTVLWGALTAYLMAIMLHFVDKDAHADYTAVTAVWGAVTGVFTQVLSFHRGSSQGSKDNRALLDKMVSKH